MSKEDSDQSIYWSKKLQIGHDKINQFAIDVYKLIENKLTLGLTSKNLFNTKRFRNFSVSDIGTSTTEYRLLPRFVLLKLEYRF